MASRCSAENKGFSLRSGAKKQDRVKFSADRIFQGQPEQLINDLGGWDRNFHQRNQVLQFCQWNFGPCLNHKERPSDLSKRVNMRAFAKISDLTGTWNDQSKRIRCLGDGCRRSVPGTHSSRQVNLVRFRLNQASSRFHHSISLNDESAINEGELLDRLIHKRIKNVSVLLGVSVKWIKVELFGTFDYLSVISQDKHGSNGFSFPARRGQLGGNGSQAFQRFCRNVVGTHLITLTDDRFEFLIHVDHKNRIQLTTAGMPPIQQTRSSENSRVRPRRMAARSWKLDRERARTARVREARWCVLSSSETPSPASTTLKFGKVIRGQSGWESSVKTSMVEQSAALAILAASSVSNLLNLVRRRAAVIHVRKYVAQRFEFVLFAGIHKSMINCPEKPGKSGEKREIILCLFIGQKQEDKTNVLVTVPPFEGKPAGHLPTANAYRRFMETRAWGRATLTDVTGKWFLAQQFLNTFLRLAAVSSWVPNVSNNSNMQSQGPAKTGQLSENSKMYRSILILQKSVQADGPICPVNRGAIIFPT